MALPANQTILRAAQVSQRTGLPISSIYKLISQGTFPRPIPLSFQQSGLPSRVGWLETDIQEWIDDKIAREVARLNNRERRPLHPRKKDPSKQDAERSASRSTATTRAKSPTKPKSKRR